MNYIDHIKGYLSRAALLLLLAGGALMAGCEDFLVRDVPNQTTDEEWWQNKGQLNTALNNLYKPMPSGTITYVNHDVKQSQASGYPNARVEMEALTDNGVGSANYVSYNAFTAGITSSSEDVCNKIWNMKWTVIRRCCRFMEHYQQATVAPDAAPHEGIQTVDRFAAEARALRAFYHLELFLFFGDIPLVDHSTLPTEQFLVRRPQQEVVDWIAGELEGASHNLPVVPQTKSERWRWTKGACYAWMSYLYLYVGDWANAKKWAEEVVKLGIYDLYRSTADPADSFRRQFIHEAYNNDTKESILTTELGMRQVQRRLAPPDGGNGQTGLSPTASLVDEFELLDGRTLDELPADEKRAYQLDPQPEKRDPRLGMSIIFPTETFLGYTAHPWGAFAQGRHRQGGFDEDRLLDQEVGERNRPHQLQQYGRRQARLPEHALCGGAAQLRRSCHRAEPAERSEYLRLSRRHPRPCGNAARGSNEVRYADEAARTGTPRAPCGTGLRGTPSVRYPPLADRRAGDERRGLRRDASGCRRPLPGPDARLQPQPRLPVAHSGR